MHIIRKIKNYFLIKKYPFLLCRNRWNDKPVIDKYLFTELDELPVGWRKRFGKQLCEDLLQLFKQSRCYNYKEKYRIAQVKEKYGRLRWYDNGVPDDICDQYNQLIEFYTELSENTCVICGKPGEIDKMQYWIEPLCKKHKK